jgi:hypothetical protein
MATVSTLAHCVDGDVYVADRDRIFFCRLISHGD